MILLYYLMDIIWINILLRVKEIGKSLASHATKPNITWILGTTDNSPTQSWGLIRTTSTFPNTNSQNAVNQIHST